MLVNLDQPSCSSSSPGGMSAVMMDSTCCLGHVHSAEGPSCVTICRDYQRYGNFLGLKGEATNVAESQAQLKQKGDFTNKLNEKDIAQSRKEGTPADRCG